MRGWGMVACGALVMATASASAAPVQICANDLDSGPGFDFGVSGGLSGVTTTESIQGFPSPLSRRCFAAAGRLAGRLSPSSRPSWRKIVGRE